MARAFFSHNLRDNLSQTCSFCWILKDHAYFHFMLCQTKIMTSFLQKVQKALFWVQKRKKDAEQCSKRFGLKIINYFINKQMSSSTAKIISNVPICTITVSSKSRKNSLFRLFYKTVCKNIYLQYFLLDDINSPIITSI